MSTFRKKFWKNFEKKIWKNFEKNFEKKNLKKFWKKFWKLLKNNFEKKMKKILSQTWTLSTLREIWRVYTKSIIDRKELGQSFRPGPISKTIGISCCKKIKILYVWYYANFLIALVFLKENLSYVLIMDKAHKY